jgi:hypothetical protein
MELQFYPPGYQPFQDAISCDATHWRAAVTIDSLESLPERQYRGGHDMSQRQLHVRGAV